MALQREHAIAAKAVPVLWFKQYTGAGLTKAAQMHRTVASQRYRSFTAFEQGFAESCTDVVRRMVEVPVAIENGADALVEIEDDVAKRLPRR